MIAVTPNSTERTPCAGTYALHDRRFAAARLPDGTHEKLCSHFHETPETAIQCARRKLRQGVLGELIEKGYSRRELAAMTNTGDYKNGQTLGGRQGGWQGKAIRAFERDYQRELTLDECVAITANTQADVRAHYKSETGQPAPF